MDIQGALAGISVYNSMTTYPLLCLKGLAISTQEKTTEDQAARMKDYLAKFRDQFADVILRYANSDESAMLKNISVYEGIDAVTKDNESLLRDVVSKLESLVQLIDEILKGRRPSHDQARSFIPFLMDMIERSERSLSRSKYENYFLGHPAVNH